MNATLVIIEDFSHHYPELTSGVNLNIGGNLALMVAVMVVLLIIAVVTVIAVWKKPCGYAKGFAVVMATVIAAVPIYVMNNDDATVATARFFTPDDVTDAYDEMVAEVSGNERLAHRVGQDIHRFMPVGNAAIESREVVCGQGDNAESLLCGGGQLTPIVYEVTADDDGEKNGPLSRLSMTPTMTYDEDNDQVWVKVAVEFAAR